MLWKKSETLFDVVFFVNANSKGWILDRICREIAYNTDLHCKIIYIPTNGLVTQNIPPANSYFFSHFEIAMNLADHKRISKGRRFIYFTHPDPARNIDMPRLLSTLNNCEKTYAMNGHDQRWLSMLGVQENRIGKMVGGVDVDHFVPTQRPANVRPIAGIVSAFYLRKNPDLLLDVVSTTPDWDFHLVAPGKEHTPNTGLLWQNWDKIDELNSFNNFKLIEAPYEIYLSKFQKFDAYLSLSKMEGGPIPLLECLSLGIPAIATDTGFAPDVIQTNTNGRLIPKDATAKDVKDALEGIATLDRNKIRETALSYSWKSISETFARDFDNSIKGHKIIEFNDQSNAEMYLGSGWSSLEPVGVWSIQKEAFIEFDVANANTDLPCSLSVAVISKHKTKQKIKISLSGTQFKKWINVDCNTQQEITVNLPHKALQAANNNLSIEVPELIDASEFNAADNRKLGIRLFKAKFGKA